MAAKLSLFALSALLLFAASSTASSALDVDCSVSAVVHSLFDTGVRCDVNEDGRASSPDLSAASSLSAQPACPGTATLELAVDNQSASDPLPARFWGQRLSADCAASDAQTSFDLEVNCTGSLCTSLDNLAPGRWVLSASFSTLDTSQTQHVPALLLAGAQQNHVAVTAFASSFRVSSVANEGNGSLRQALQLAPARPKPLLIWFDESAFPSGVLTKIELAFQLTGLAADAVTMDGTDGLGQYGNRAVDAGGHPFGAFRVTGADNRLVGLRFRGAGSNDRDVLSIAGSMAQRNRIEHCVVEQSASADGIGVVDGAGADLEESANVIADTEVYGAVDKGVKVTTGSHARIERVWVHDNGNGGIQATLGGRVRVTDSLVERNAGGTAQNGLAVQAVDLNDVTSYLEVVRSIARHNGANGLSNRSSTAVVQNSYFAENGTAGLRVFNDVATPAEALVEGSSAVCNGTDGVVVADQSVADFGGGPLLSAGLNAFAQNDLPGGAANLRNATGSTVWATHSQWEHCGRLSQCDETAIRGHDLSDGGRSTEISPALAHRGADVPVIAAIIPSRAVAGDLVRLIGTGFNVIDGLFAEGECGDVAGRNRCVPLRGNCVRVGGVAAQVEAVTPTMLVIRWPFTCLAPVSVTVTVDKGASGAISLPAVACGG